MFKLTDIIYQGYKMLKPVLQPKQSGSRNYLTVSQLNRKVKGLLEQQLGQLWVEGEVSNFSTPASGHWYFTLKDDSAQVRCAMWRGKNQLLRFIPKDGQQVLVRVKATLYEARGDYQLTVDYIEPAGIGALQLQFEQLKEKLSNEGLFDQSRKKAIPEFPTRIGLITSPSGAAIRDVLSIMERRFPLTEIIVYPSQVQGKEAHLSLIKAIQTANQRDEVDLLLITRGGGSLEDLWCFNEATLAYEIAKSQLPTISAVGHEVDYTISDFVADLRAPTPSAAAEIITQDQEQVTQQIDDLCYQLYNQFIAYINGREAELNYLRLKLDEPEPLLVKHQLRVQEKANRLAAIMGQKVQQRQQDLHTLQLQLTRLHPEQKLRYFSSQLASITNRLSRALQVLIKEHQQQLAAAAGKLNTVSPLATLERGYSITLSNNQVVRSIDQIKSGENIETRLADGIVGSVVNSISSSSTTDEAT